MSSLSRIFVFFIILNGQASVVRLGGQAFSKIFFKALIRLVTFDTQVSPCGGYFPSALGEPPDMCCTPVFEQNPLLVYRLYPTFAQFGLSVSLACCMHGS